MKIKVIWSVKYTHDQLLLFMFCRGHRLGVFSKRRLQLSSCQRLSTARETRDTRPTKAKPRAQPTRAVA